MTIHPDAQVTLEQLRDQLAAENPDKTFLVDSGVVYLRYGGRDYGYYSALCNGPKVVYCVRDGHSVVTRPTPQ